MAMIGFVGGFGISRRRSRTRTVTCVAAAPSVVEQPTEASLDALRNAERRSNVRVQGRIIKTGMDEVDRGLPSDYEPEVIEKYWNKRPLQVQRRVLEVGSTIAPFAAKLWFYRQTNQLDAKKKQIAADLRDILTKLGPTFIKLGQGLSVRPDLIGPDLMQELQTLCDSVPGFENEKAFAIVEDELGAPVSELFADVSQKPVAAASIGQVYKAKIRETGATIALKVQRPDMLRRVSLDLYLLRKLMYVAQDVQDRFTANKTDFVSLLTAWAAGTYKELDYRHEGKNAVRFAQMMSNLEDIVVPDVYFEYTGRKVIAMEWIDGVKLADASADQISNLVSLGVEAFLQQLLTLGFIQADPHGGNLLATPDGKLCILDYGLMCTVNRGQMEAMVASIIHLANRDYERVVDDFIELDFLPPTVDKDAVVPVLGAVLDQALEGGGAKNVNFQSLSSELSQITFDFPFKVPPYFALIIRALGILEGIALTADPDFRLVMQAYPYVAKKLLQERSPALSEALRQILYRDGTFSPARLQTLVESSQGFLGEGDAFVDFDTPPNQLSSREALEFLFSDNGSVLREIIADEVANGVDVVARSVVPLSLGNFTRVVPTPILQLVPGGTSSLSEDDEQYLRNLRGLLRFLLYSRTRGLQNGSLANDIQSVARDILELGRQFDVIFPKLHNMNKRIVGSLAERAVARAFDRVRVQQSLRR